MREISISVYCLNTCRRKVQLHSIIQYRHTANLSGCLNLKKDLEILASAVSVILLPLQEKMCATNQIAPRSVIPRSLLPTPKSSLTRFSRVTGSRPFLIKHRSLKIVKAGQVKKRWRRSSICPQLTHSRETSEKCARCARALTLFVLTKTKKFLIFRGKKLRLKCWNSFP